jgi:hypothetical protein
MASFVYLISVLWICHQATAAADACGYYLYSFLIYLSKILEISYALFLGYRF